MLISSGGPLSGDGTHGIARAALLGAPILGLLLAAPGIAAQTFPASISGTVRDSLGEVVPAVDFSERASGRRARSDTAGQYHLRGLPPGNVYVEVRRLGYRTMVIDTVLREGERLAVDLVLTPVPRLLETVTVNEHGEPVTRSMLDFERRRRTAAGVFVTRRDIEARRPHHLTDMFRTAPGVVIRGGGMGGYSLRLTRGGMCTPDYYVDGHFQPGLELDVIPPADIEGIELYRGSSEIPPQFNRFNAMCGVVVIWTRDPEAG